MFNTSAPLISISGKLLTHIPQPLQFGFLTPLVCGCELWRCLDVHIMLCPSLAAGCCGLTRRSEQSWCVAAWHTSEKCQRSGADKVGENSHSKVPFWRSTFSLSLLLFLTIFLNLVYLSLPRESISSILLYNSQTLSKICHSCESSSACSVSVLAAGNSPNCALCLRNTGLIFTQAMPQGKMRQHVQN